MKRIAIHGAPRSGTSWLGEIINSCPTVIYKFQPLFSYRFRGMLNEGSQPEDIAAFFQTIAETADNFCDQVQARHEGRLPVFSKSPPTHVAYKEVRFHHLLWNLLRKSSNVHFVFLIRSPLSTLLSWLRAPREFRADLGWRVEDEWRYALKKNLNRPEEFNGFEKWKDCAATFTALASSFPDRVTLVSYSSLINDTRPTVEELFRRCELPWSTQTERFLEASTQAGSERHPYGTFNHRKSDHDWKREIPVAIQEEIMNDLKGSDLHKYLEW